MRRYSKCLGIATLALCAGSVFSASPREQDRTTRLVQTLNEWKIYNYTEHYLDQKMKESPEDADLYRSLLAETYILQKKTEKAEKIITSIPPTSPAYLDAQAVWGRYLFQTQKNEDAVKALVKIYDYCKANPDKYPERYKTSLSILLQVYRNTGKNKESNELIEFLTNGADPREKLCIKVSLTLTTAANLKKKETEEEAKKFTSAREERNKLYDKGMNAQTKKKLEGVNNSDWQSVVYGAIVELEPILWSSDVVTAMAVGYTAQALNILERYDDAIKEVGKYKSLFKACDDAFLEAKEMKNSPTNFARIQEAEAYRGKAKKASSSEDQLRFLKRSFVIYGKLLKSVEGFRDAPKAYNDFSAIGDELVAMDSSLEATINSLKSTVPVPSGGDASKSDEVTEELLTAKHNQLFETKKYQELVQELVPIFVEKRLSGGLPPILEKLSYSYAYLKQPLEAMSVASYAAIAFPKSPYTPVLLFNTGNLLWDSKNRDDACFVYEKFLENDIANQNAPVIATRRAGHAFDKGRRLVEEANKLVGDEKRKKNAEAFLEFRRSIRFSKIITDNFSFSKKFADNAFLNIGAAYATLEEFKEAMGTYKDFFESNPENPTQIVQAKSYLIGVTYKAAMKLEKEAKQIREEAYAMVEEPVPVKVATPAEKSEQAGEEAASNEVPPAADQKQSVPAEKSEQAGSKEAPAASEATDPSQIQVIQEVKIVDEGSKEGKLKNAKDLQDEAVELYAEASKESKELIGWLSNNGKYVKLIPAETKEKVLEDTYFLLPWIEDGTGDKKQAVADFMNYIKLYPKDKKVPGSMMRVGVLYTELGDNDHAAQILDRLSSEFKDTPEGKNAKFYLGRALFNNGNYKKSIAVFGEVFADKALKENLSISNLRWIASNLGNCGESEKMAGANIALSACEVLLAQLNDKPNLNDWFGAERVAQLKANQAEQTRVLSITKEKILFDAANAALAAATPASLIKAEDFFGKVLANKETPYYYDASFGRAEAYQKLGGPINLRKAMADLGNIALRASTTGVFSLYNKAQVIQGNIQLAEKDYKRAFAAFNMIASPAFSDEDEPAPDRSALSPEEIVKLDKKEEDKKASREWVEEAIYRTAYCAALLGKDAERDKMAAKYKKYFMGGRFEKNLDSLPQAEPAPEK